MNILSRGRNLLSGAPRRSMRASDAAFEICQLLADSGVADLNGLATVERLVGEHLAGERTFHEIIFDHPVSANWRLVDRSDRLHIGYWGDNPDCLALSRELDAQLGEILARF